MDIIDNIELSNTHDFDCDQLNYSSEDNSVYDNNGHKLIVSPNLQEILNITDQKKGEILGKYFTKVNTTIDHDFENNLYILKEHRLLVGGGNSLPPKSKHFRPQWGPRLDPNQYYLPSEDHRGWRPRTGPMTPPDGLPYGPPNDNKTFGE